MMKMGKSVLVLMVMSFLLFGITSAQDDETIFESGVVDRSGGWRLPFSDGSRYITNGPLEDWHVGRSAEAIDYSIGGATAPWVVLSPANGVVADVCLISQQCQHEGFGNFVRINHNGIYSMFAHLDVITATVGSTVKQGKPVGATGNTGNGQGYHLHFEARTGVTPGVVSSGNASPIRSIPGNWWNTWYSPPPNFQHSVPDPSGGAQYPENSARPSTTYTGARHLSNQQSPTAAPAGWNSNIAPNSITLHFGAAPHTPNTNWYATFYLWTLLEGYPTNSWFAVPPGSTTNSPSRTMSINQNTRFLPTGQHVYSANSSNAQSGSCALPSCYRYWEIWPGDSENAPHLAANFRQDTDNTTLDFCTPEANKYKVFESRNGAPSQQIYAGPGCSIMVHRQLGGGSSYNVTARIPNSGGWSPYSPWLIIHW